MFQPGDKIIYSSSGVCSVEEVAVPPFAGKNEKDRLYYKLRPVGSSETIYAPVDSPVFMRPIMTREEAEALVARIPSIGEETCSSRSIVMLRQQYEAILKDHSCEGYVALVKGIYMKGHSGKKLGQTDQRYMKRAEDMLYGELAAALDISPEDVPEYIKKTIEG